MTPARVLVTGAGGQLGRAVLTAARARWPDVTVVGCTRADLDLTNPAQLAARLDALTVGTAGASAVVINAAAYTAVDTAEVDADAAASVNHHGAGELARACASRGVFLVHVSTDFVFGDGHDRPIPVDAPTAPLGVYGRTKRDGELAVLREHPSGAAVVRTSWLYAADGRNFVLTMLRLLRERGEVRVVDDQVGTPTAVTTLADALLRLAQARLTGVFHVADAGVASWYDLACAVAAEGAAVGLLPADCRVHPIPSDAYPTPARRPRYSVLERHGSWQRLGIVPRHWRAALVDVLRELADAHRSGR